MTDGLGDAIARGLADVTREIVREEMARHNSRPSPSMSDGPDLVRITGMAAEIGVCEGSIRKLSREGLIKIYCRPGSRLKFVCRREVMRALAQTTQAVGTPDEWAKKRIRKAAK